MSDRIRIAALDDTLFEPAFDLTTRVFCEGSTLHQALGVDLQSYRAYLREPFEAMVSEGHSLVVMDDHTGAVLGCVIATDIALHSDPAPAPPLFAPLTALTTQLTRAYLDHRQPKLGQALLVDMAVVDPKAGGQGVYRNLRQACHDRAGARGYHWIVGELSSPATQHVVVNHFGHQIVDQITLASFEYGGQRPFAGITTPDKIILTEGHLETAT